MPQWMHNRAEHILAKNPDMPKSEAFAIATQQGHALGKNPKGYGTAKGKRVAKRKFDTSKDDVKSANPGSLESPKMASSEEGGRAPSAEDKQAIHDFIVSHPGLKDEDYHAFLERKGVNVPKGEAAAYAALRKEHMDTKYASMSRELLKEAVSNAWIRRHAASGVRKRMKNPTEIGFNLLDKGEKYLKKAKDEPYAEHQRKLRTLGDTIKGTVHEVVKKGSAYASMREKLADLIPGGKADEKTDKDFDKGQLGKGEKVEQEHSKGNRTLAREIARDHLQEIPDYYTRLAKMEDEAPKRKEASMKFELLKIAFKAPILGSALGAGLGAGTGLLYADAQEDPSGEPRNWKDYAGPAAVGAVAGGATGAGVQLGGRALRNWMAPKPITPPGGASGVVQGESPAGFSMEALADQLQSIMGGGGRQEASAATQAPAGRANFADQLMGHIRGTLSGDVSPNAPLPAGVAEAAQEARDIAGRLKTHPSMAGVSPEDQAEIARVLQRNRGYDAARAQAGSLQQRFDEGMQRVDEAGNRMKSAIDRFEPGAAPQSTGLRAPTVEPPTPTTIDMSARPLPGGGEEFVPTGVAPTAQGPAPASSGFPTTLEGMQQALKDKKKTWEF